MELLVFNPDIRLRTGRCAKTSLDTIDPSPGESDNTSLVKIMLLPPLPRRIEKGKFGPDVPLVPRSTSGYIRAIPAGTRDKMPPTEVVPGASTVI